MKVVLLTLLLFYATNSNARQKAYADYPSNGKVFTLNVNGIYAYNIACTGHFRYVPDAGWSSTIYDRDKKKTISNPVGKSQTQRHFSHPVFTFDCPRRYFHQWIGTCYTSGGGISTDGDRNYFRIRLYCPNPNPPCSFVLCDPHESIVGEDFSKNFDSYETFEPIKDLVPNK